MSLRIGTRASKLARWQAEWVARELTRLGTPVELIPITTSGDANQTGPIGNLGTVGVFTKEIQTALLDGRIDLAVHSLKDLPTDKVPGLTLAAVPTREATGDCLLSSGHVRFEDLPAGAVIGTGSLRRQAQILHRRPDLNVADIRGNVDTRIAKLQADDFDAIILAEAGLRRLDLFGQVTEVLPAEWMLPAVGQGALGLEAREDDEATLAAVETLNDLSTFAAVTAERSLLQTLLGGCLAPVGALAQVIDNRLTLEAAVLSGDGKQQVTASGEIRFGESPGKQVATELGRTVAKDLLGQGAGELIRATRSREG